MSQTRPRILLIGGTYRALCVLERLLERGEHVVAFIGQEGGGERDFCPEILEICDRSQIPARSANKLGEEIVRWLEDRIRPDLALAVGTNLRVPLSVGGNARLGLVELVDYLAKDDCPGVALRQRGRDLVARELEPPEGEIDGGEAYLHVVEELVALLDSYLDDLPGETAGEPDVRVPFDATDVDDDALERAIERPDPGAETDYLERELAAYTGAEHALALGSPADAWRLLVQALSLGPGDEIICPGFASRAALVAIRDSGATAVFADVEPSTLAADPDSVSEILTDRTRALLIAHPFGQPAPLDQLYTLAKEAGLEVLEDASASLGARFQESRLGRSPCTAVFRMPLACCDSAFEAGLVTLPAALAERLEPLAKPLRLGDGAAELARHKLAHWDDRVAARRERALVYCSELGRYDAFRIPSTPDGCLPTYSAFVLGVTRFARTSADDLVKLLAESGVEARRIAPLGSDRSLAELPITDQLRMSSVLLPVHSQLTAAQQDHILDALFGYAIG